MEDIAKKLIWLVFIFPGFVTVTIVSAIVDLGEVGELSLIFYALALTFLNVVIGFLVSLLIALFLRPFSVRPGLFSSLVIFTVATLLVSIGSGIVIGIALEQG